MRKSFSSFSRSFFAASHKDTLEMLGSALEGGSSSQVCAFRAFHAALQMSHTRQLAALHTTLHLLLTYLLSHFVEKGAELSSSSFAPDVPDSFDTFFFEKLPIVGSNNADTMKQWRAFWSSIGLHPAGGPPPPAQSAAMRASLNFDCSVRPPFAPPKNASCSRLAVIEWWEELDDLPTCTRGSSGGGRGSGGGGGGGSILNLDELWWQQPAALAPDGDSVFDTARNTARAWKGVLL